MVQENQHPKPIMEPSIHKIADDHDRAKSKAPLSISIQPLQYTDIESCSEITSAAFDEDPHTVVKQLGRNGYDMFTMTYTSLFNNLSKKNYIHVKAVDEQTGEILGHASWAFRGVDVTTLIPWNGPSDPKPDLPDALSDNAKGQDEGKDERGPSSIDTLHALEDADMQSWLSQIPSDTPCIFVIGLIVSPSHQRHGVGRRILQHGNAIADKLGMSVWVHSSHQAYEMYKKSGFEVVRTLEINLDEYAPRAPREGEPVMAGDGEREDRGNADENEENHRWGMYIIRYMKRAPDANAVNRSILPTGNGC